MSTHVPDGGAPGTGCPHLPQMQTETATLGPVGPEGQMWLVGDWCPRALSPDSGKRVGVLNTRSPSDIAQTCVLPRKPPVAGREMPWAGDGSSFWLPFLTPLLLLWGSWSKTHGVDPTPELGSSQLVPGGSSHLRKPASRSPLVTREKTV